MRYRQQTYAITIVAYQRRRVFQRDAIAERFINTLFRYRDSGKFFLHGFVAMPDHCHVLITPGLDLSVERCAQLIKGGFSFAVRKEYPGEIWQEGYHAHRVTDEADLLNQMRYIVDNPRRKHLESYPHVHTSEKYERRVDPLPEIFV